MKPSQTKQRKFLTSYKIPEVGEPKGSVFGKPDPAGIDWVDLRERMQKKYDESMKDKKEEERRAKRQEEFNKTRHGLEEAEKWLEQEIQEIQSLYISEEEERNLLCTPEADDEEALLCVQEDLVQELDRMDLVLSGVLPEEPVVVKEVQSLEAPIVQSLEALTISVEEQPQPVQQQESRQAVPRCKVRCPKCKKRGHVRVNCSNLSVQAIKKWAAELKTDSALMALIPSPPGQDLFSLVPAPPPL